MSRGLSERRGLAPSTIKYSLHILWSENSQPLNSRWPRATWEADLELANKEPALCKGRPRQQSHSSAAGPWAGAADSPTPPHASPPAGKTGCSSLPTWPSGCPGHSEASPAPPQSRWGRPWMQCSRAVLHSAHGWSWPAAYSHRQSPTAESAGSHKPGLISVLSYRRREAKAKVPHSSCSMQPAKGAFARVSKYKGNMG